MTARAHSRLRKAVAGCAVAALLAAAVFPAAGARAHSARLGDIMIGHLWNPPANTGTAFVYGPFLNRGEQADRLVSASTDIAGEARFCAPQKAGGTCRESIALVPGRPYAMAPWRTAIRLTGLKRALEKGDGFDLTLTFEKAGAVTVQVVVEESSGH